MRSPRWAWEGYILAGSLNGLVGPGGAGKGTFMAWMIARLTRGELPGSLKGTPATVLVIGDEDAPDEIWTPRIVAAGGDERRVHVLEYDSGAPLSLVRDIGRLEEIIRELGAELVYFDQVLDHFSADDNSHVAKDVRLVLGPIKNLARRLEIAAVYTTPPNKWAGRGRRATALAGLASSSTCPGRCWGSAGTTSGMAGARSPGGRATSGGSRRRSRSRSSPASPVIRRPAR
jgi:hypothetical protein